MTYHGSASQCLGDDVLDFVLVEELSDRLGLQDLGLVIHLQTDRRSASADHGSGLDGAVKNLVNAYLEGQLGLPGCGIGRRLGLVGGFGLIYDEGHEFFKIGSSLPRSLLGVVSSMELSLKISFN